MNPAFEMGATVEALVSEGKLDPACAQIFRSKGQSIHLYRHQQMAFHPADDEGPAARGGVIRTRQVSRRTTLFLLRLRFLIYERGDSRPTLAEETLVWGIQRQPDEITPLTLDEAQQLLDSAATAESVPSAEKRDWWSWPICAKPLSGRARSRRRPSCCAWC